VTNLNRNKLYNDTEEFADKPDELKKDFMVETGKCLRCRHAASSTRRQTSTSGLVYSLNFVDRWDGVTRTYNPIWDRRHNVNLVASYTFGKFDSWKANARWNYGSGFPFTPHRASMNGTPSTGGIGTDITTANGDLATIYGDLNSGRLPDYHRLDLGLTKTWRFDEHQPAGGWTSA
jgi:hypothetical protein